MLPAPSLQAIQFAIAADELVFLGDGHAVESGPPERMLDAPEDDRTQRFLRRVNGGRR